MKRFTDLELKYQILIIFGVVVVIALIVIFVPKYKGPEENCTFIGEEANLHNEYYITVKNVNDYDSIFILKNPEDIEETKLIGEDKRYVGVEIIVSHINISTPKETKKLDINDFKIKDHTGVQFKNFYFFVKENGLAVETNNFSTRTPIKDYKWFGKEIYPGETFEFILYFEFPKSLSSANTLMVLETDFFIGARKNKAGTDIVLIHRARTINKLMKYLSANLMQKNPKTNLHFLLYFCCKVEKKE